MRKEIESLAALREKIVGVQSIGGGFWLQTMIVLDRLGVDPEKNKLQLRVIGDEPTILQALLASNIDAAVITFASAAWQRGPAFVRWQIRRISRFLIKESASARAAIGLPILRISSCAW